MLASIDPVDIAQQAPVAAIVGRERRLRNALDQMIVAPAIRDQIPDRTHFQAVQTRESDKIVHPRHRTVILHDLADHAGRIEPGEPRDIDRSLGMPRPHEHTAIARDEREHMAGRNDIVLSLGGIDRHGDGARAISR